MRVLSAGGQDASMRVEPGEPPDPGSEASTPTIYDVARAAGVSIASVSRVLNGRPSDVVDGGRGRLGTGIGGFTRLDARGSVLPPR